MIADSRDGGRARRGHDGTFRSRECGRRSVGATLLLGTISSSTGRECCLSTNASAPSGPIVRSVTPPFRPEAAAQGHERGCYIGAGPGGPPGGFERPALAVVGCTAGRSPADAARDHGPRPGLWRAAASDEEQLRSLTGLLLDEGKCGASTDRVLARVPLVRGGGPRGGFRAVFRGGARFSVGRRRRVADRGLGERVWGSLLGCSEVACGEGA
jgi:hypothetical protein